MMRLLTWLFFALPYEYFLTGNARDLRTRPEFGVMLGGGGGDNDQAYRWLLQRARGGDAVVLRASGTDSYNQHFSGLGQVDSVETFVVRDTDGASDPVLIKKITAAEMIFIAGGDQWNYVRLWRDKPVGRALNDAVRRGVPIGGTSAGLAILGQYSFSAEHDTVHSREALANPYDLKVTISGHFLRVPGLAGVITDSHFSARDRMGRLIVFLARIAKDRGRARGIGIDERTAILLDRNGRGTVCGSGAAYFLEMDKPPRKCDQKMPLTVDDVRVQRVGGGETWDFSSWKFSPIESYSIRVDEGRLISSRKAIY